MTAPINAHLVGGPLDGSWIVLPSAQSVYEAPIRRQVGNPLYGAYVMNVVTYERSPTGLDVYSFVEERHERTA